MFEIIRIIFTIVFVYFNILFLLAITKKDNSIVDIGWGIGFIVAAWSTLIIFGDFTPLQALVTGLVTIWGSRLSWHIYLRNKDKDEDWRYNQWRKDWGKWFLLRSYFQVFVLQAVLLVLVSLPVIHFNSLGGYSSFWFIIIGLLIWALGFLIESIADYHLSRHLEDDSKEGLLTNGIWAWSRHPNYFGEASLWWGIWIITAGAIVWELSPIASSCGWWTVIGPITITILVRFVSGVPILEKNKAGDEDFEAYKKQTNIFVPLPPKNDS